MFISTFESYLSHHSIDPLEYVPLVSTFKGIYQIFQTCTSSLVEEDFPQQEHSYSLLPGKNLWRSFVMTLPVLGNVSLLIYDGIQCFFEQRTFAFFQEERLDNPRLQELFNEIKSLSQIELTNNLSDMKGLKNQWEILKIKIIDEQKIISSLSAQPDKNVQKLLFSTDAKLEIVSERVSCLKRKKHLSEVGELRYASTFRELLPWAYAGKEKEIKAFIKLGQEDRPIQKIEQGPEPESQSAKEMSNLLNLLQKNNNDLRFSFDTNTKRYVVRDTERRLLCDDFQKLLLSVDWSQVVLEEEKQGITWTIVSPVWYLLTKGHPFPQGPMKDEEYRALNMDYLRNGYLAMNSLLRGDCFSFDERGLLKHGAASINPATESKQLDDVVKKYLLKGARCIQGLSKLSDYKETEKYLWRGEKIFGNAKFETEIQRRIRAIGKGPELSHSFTSTSAHNLISTFAGGGCLTLYRNKGRGKDVRKYSPYSEQEILFPPTKIQWLYHKQLRDGVHLFIAQQV